MKKLILPFLLLCTGSLFFSCSDEKDGLDGFSSDHPTVKNTIQPMVAGNYNKWMLGNIAQLGYIETQVPNNFTAFNFYVVCDGGNLYQVEQGNPEHWRGSVSNENLRLDVAAPGNWNEWVYQGESYVYYVRTLRPDDFNGWGIYTGANVHMFDIKTTRAAGWNQWEITGNIPESHTQNFIGLFFVPVMYATTQDLIQ